MWEWIWESFYLFIRIFVILMVISIATAFIRGLWIRFNTPRDDGNRIRRDDFR